MSAPISRSTKSRAASHPPSRYTAAITASSASARIDVFSCPPAEVSPRPSSNAGPMPSRAATPANATALTTALRASVSRPSSRCGYCWYTWSATIAPSTASPRYSSRSFEGGGRSDTVACSAHHERWASACTSRAGSANSCPIRCLSTSIAGWSTRTFAHPAVDVVDRVAHGLQVFEVFVFDAEPH